MYILENANDKILVEKVYCDRYDVRFQNILKIISGGEHFKRFNDIYGNTRPHWFFDSTKNTEITPFKGKLVKALYGI